MSTKTIYRKPEILEYCKNRSVLHLGFIQHANMWRDQIKKDDWLHNQIDAVSSRLVGLDYLAKDVDDIRNEYDFEVYYADAMKLEEVKLDDTFDVIVCGELIEHVENPGLMLQGIKRFMHPESILIITTPNPWRELWVKNIQDNKPEKNWLNPEHTCWFSFQTLTQILERMGYQERRYDFYIHEHERLSTLLTQKRYRAALKEYFYQKKFVKNKNYYAEGLFFVAEVKS